MKKDTLPSLNQISFRDSHLEPLISFLDMPPHLNPLVIVLVEYTVNLGT
jgi:hypothetical protein